MSNHKRSSRKKRKRRAHNSNRPPRTAEQLAAKPERFQSLWDRIIGVISKMREDKVSLERASQDRRVSPKTVKRWAGSALQKTDEGKWSPKKDDNLLRVLVVPTEKGKREIGVRGFRQASLLGKYWDEVENYLQAGDSSGLKKFQGKEIRAANGEHISYLTV